MQIPVSSNVAPHYSRQGSLMHTTSSPKYMPPAQQADIDALVAYHKSAREYNASLDAGKTTTKDDNKPHTIKRNKKHR
jgi:hypothetical protein